MKEWLLGVLAFWLGKWLAKGAPALAKKVDDGIDSVIPEAGAAQPVNEAAKRRQRIHSNFPRPHG